ncbi:MAG: hypothetical protein D6702_04085 [Planctomycetota bacterium]|nr:MAG: hypothetical protein D6702_04085 [Planctomycetota bacterium]
MGKPIPTVEWIHVCDHAFRDESGKLCLIGLFDALHSRQLPGRLPTMAAALGITDGEGEYQVGLQVVTPSGKVIDMDLPPLHLPDRRAKQRAVVRLTGMPFEEFGRYVFRLRIDGQPQEYPCHTIDHFEMPAAEGQAAGGAGSA